VTIADELQTLTGLSSKKCEDILSQELQEPPTWRSFLKKINPLKHRDNKFEDPEPYAYEVLDFEPTNCMRIPEEGETLASRSPPTAGIERIIDNLLEGAGCAFPSHDFDREGIRRQGDPALMYPTLMYSTLMYPTLMWGCMKNYNDDYNHNYTFDVARYPSPLQRRQGRRRGLKRRRRRRGRCSMRYRERILSDNRDGGMTTTISTAPLLGSQR
jgi:hypothetical protein